MSSGRTEAPTSDRPPLHASVASFDGTPIHYDLYAAGHPVLVLVVPGFWRTRRHPSMVRFARMLDRFGCDSAVVDVRGHGDSGGRYGFNRDEHYDVAAVAAALLPRYRASALAGFSYGGAISVTAVARDRLPVSALLLISAVADFAMISPRLNLLTLHRHIALSQALKRPRVLWRPKGAGRIRAVDEISSVHVPVCLIHVRNDWLIGHPHAEALYARANEPKELHILEIPGNYHADRIFSVAAGQAEPIVSDFLSRTLPK